MFDLTSFPAFVRCCQVHDDCYTTLNRAECAALLKYRVYTTEYQWSVNDNNITCSTFACFFLSQKVLMPHFICFSKHVVYNNTAYNYIYNT